MSECPLAHSGSKADFLSSGGIFCLSYISAVSTNVCEAVQ